MSSQVVPSEQLFGVIASKTSTNDEKLKLILNLKVHVKRDFVDISQVPKYLETLSIAIDIPDNVISTNSFSVLSHLVKRVSFQDKSGKVLKDSSYLVLPIIINKLGDSRPNIRSTARKALECYWLSALKEVEQSLRDLGFGHSNARVVNESVIWLDHIIVDLCHHFKLDYFVPSLVRLLAKFSRDEEVLSSVKSLFKNYYTMKHNRLYKFDLQKELDHQNIPLPLRQSILNEIDAGASISQQRSTGSLGIASAKPKVPLSHSPTSGTSSPFALNPQPLPPHVEQTQVRPRLSSGSLRQLSRPSSRSSMSTSSLNRAKSLSHPEQPTQPKQLTQPKQPTQTKPQTPPIALSPLQHPPVQSTETSVDSNIESELSKVIVKIPNYPLDTSIKPANCFSSDELYTKITNITPCFENRESEFNWAAREKSIILLRSFLRGNAPNDYMEELVASLKEVSEGICKAVTSLRTTLSAHGCQLVKEISLLLKTASDSLVDSFLPSLLKLCSATKNIASTNANMSLSVIFLNNSFSHFKLNKILAGANEKNISPRSYSGLWLQIILIRFHNNVSFLSQHPTSGNTGIDVSRKVLTKLLNDPNPTVRQSAKDTYWCFWSKFKHEGETFLSKFDSNIVKGVERSKPKALEGRASIAHVLPPTKSRPSIKDSIIAKNREMRAKQKEEASRPSSRSSSRVASRPSVDNFERELTTRPSRNFSETIKRAPSKILGVPKRASSATSLNIQSESLKAARSKTPEMTPARSSTVALSSTELGGWNGHHESNNMIKPNRSLSAFDKQKDPILNFLSSNKPEFIQDGIHLLRYAIMSDEDLCDEISVLLRKVSIENPDCLRPLFLEGENLLKKVSKFFDPEDFIRICTLLLAATDKNVDIIISILEVDDIYKSTSNILSYVSNLSNIEEDGQLTMQVIRYKSTITAMLIEFLIKCTEKIPISDGQFIKLITVLFDLISLLRSTETFSPFTTLLTKLNSINPHLFATELRMTSAVIKEEVESMTGVSHSIDFPDTTNYALSELTKVNLSKAGELSPLKQPSDLTMLVPSRRGGPDSTIVFNKVEEPNSHRVVSTTHAMEVDSDVSNSKPLSVEKMGDAASLTSNAHARSPLNRQAEDAKSINLDAEPDFDKEVDDNIDLEYDDENDHVSKTSKLNFQESDNRHATAPPQQPAQVPREEDAGLSRQSSNDGGRSLTGQASPIISQESHNVSHKHVVSSDRDLLSKQVQPLGHEEDRSQGKPVTTGHQSDSAELAEDFAQVKITELKNQLGETNSRSIQSFIEKIDPLNKISNKNKPITIFHDDQVSGSPQKVRDYSYSELNWFNFQIAKLSLEQGNNFSKMQNDGNSSRFKELCSRLSDPTGKRHECIDLLPYLQGTQTPEFAEYFRSEGQPLIEKSLWSFFDAVSQSNTQDILSRLMIVKQLLINRTNISLDHLWRSLCKTSQFPDDNINELALAIGETYDEVLSGTYSTSDLLACTVHSLKKLKSDPQDRSIPFVISCLCKLLSTNSFNLMIDDDVVAQIDEDLCHFVNHKKVDVRRLVISSYGKLLKASRTVDINSSVTAKDNNCMAAIIQKLSLPQQKLVESYSIG